MRRRSFIALPSLLSLSIPGLASTKTSISSAANVSPIQEAIAAIKSGPSRTSFWQHYQATQVFGSTKIPMIVLIATHGPLSLLKAAASRGADLNTASTVGHTALKASLLRPSIPLAEWLHESGAKIDIGGRHTELDSATIGGDEDCIDFIINTGQSPTPSTIALALTASRYRIAEGYWRLTGASETSRNQVTTLISHRNDLVQVASGWIR